MCGIAGIVSLDGREPEASVIYAMTKAIAHRGPDGEGFLLAGGSFFSGRKAGFNFETFESSRPLHFGHRRLSIIDLSDAASQPMADISQQFHIVFNGEIYNHKEIRTELEKKGHAFRTNHSDTEVILEAYKAWGTECLQHFRGMFAFALWDKQADVVWLARDRFGKKPLYYSIKNGFFYFASEIKSILCSPEVSFEMDLQGLSDYLSLTYVPPPLTLFKNIRKLAAGHQMFVRQGVVSEQHPYYNIFENLAENRIETEKDAIEGFETLFSEAVKLRQEADVQYGAYLSGGVDSSAIVGKLSQLTGKPAHTFSVGYSESIHGYTSELRYARIVAEHFGSRHYEKVISGEEIKSAIPLLTWHMDEPISDSACIPIYMLSKLAKDNGVTVCLGGEGSDESFIGYQLWRFMYRYHELNERFPFLKKPIRTIVSHPIIRSRRSFYTDWSDRILRNEIMFRGGVEFFSDEEKNKLFRKGFQESHHIEPVYRVIDQISNRYDRESGGGNFLNKMTYIDLNLRLPELLLARLDKMSMAAGVEARTPFMDHKLVEFSLKIPPSLKINNQTEKYIVKKGVENLLPHQIIYRQKEGFMMPTYHFLDNHLKGYMHDKILSFAKSADFMSDEMLLSLLNAENDSHSWYFLNLAVWWEQFMGAD